MTAIVVALALAAQKALFLQRPTGNYLGIGGKIYAMSKGASFPFDHGELVEKDQILVLKKDGASKGSFDLKALLKNWLKDDEKWGSHNDANGVRYMAGAGGGISADLSECYEAPDETALAIMDIHCDGPSEIPITAQFLFHVSSAPFNFKLLRRLPLVSRLNRVRRIYPTSKGLFCLEGHEIDRIDFKGNKKARFCSWQGGENPDGFSANRWIIGESDDQELHRIIATDLFRGKSFDLLKVAAKNPPIVAPPQFIATEENSPYTLIRQDIPNRQKSKFFTIHLPEGTRQAMSGTAYAIAGPYAVYQRVDGVDVYSAKTGRLVNR